MNEFIRVKELELIFFCPYSFYLNKVLGFERKKEQVFEKGKKIQGEIRNVVYVFLLKEVEPGRIMEEVEMTDSELGLKGKVDMLLLFENEIVPIEIKWTPKFYPWWIYNLATYAILAQRTFEKPVKKALLIRIKRGRGDCKVIWMDDTLRNSVFWALRLARKILEGKIPMKYGRCKNCDFKHVCPASFPVR